MQTSQEVTMLHWHTQVRCRSETVRKQALPMSSDEAVPKDTTVLSMCDEWQEF